MSTEVVWQEIKCAIERASNGRAVVHIGDREARIVEDLGLSSLSLMDLRCELEEVWRIRISDIDLVQLRTMGDIIDFREKQSRP